MERKQAAAGNLQELEQKLKSKRVKTEDRGLHWSRTHDRYGGECDGPLRLLSKHWEDNIQKFSPSRIPELPRVTAMS
ncbi:hypothetical protein pipiens_016627 [Culex pipiens pipiens]|uniref:Uncharacterized protein n=1 Tax=Culex pipiens pipiens TaxID=38569 RepID=A0ABD1CKF5_CULPP